MNGLGGIKLADLLQRGRGLQPLTDRLEDAQVLVLEFGDHRLARIAKLDLERDFQTGQEAFLTPGLSADFLNTGNIAHLTSLLILAQLLPEMLSQRFGQLQEPVDEPKQVQNLCP